MFGDLGEDDPQVRKLLFQFLASRCKRESMLDMFRNCNFPQKGGYSSGYLDLPALHIIARVGFTSICRSVLISDKASAQDYLSDANLGSSVSEMLLAEMRNVVAEDKFGDTALHYAARAGHEEIVMALLERDADVAARNHEGNTALHFGSWNGHESVVRVLLEMGSDVCLKNAQGFTALHCAASIGHIDIVLALLQAERKSCRLLDSKYDEYNEQLQDLPDFLKKIRTLLFLASLHPTDHIYATLLGSSLWERKMFSRAINFYDVGLRLNPSNALITRLDDVHHVAACDSCYETIIGVRYRCVECNDFDLCSKCNSNPSHWHTQLCHFFLTIPGDNWSAEFVSGSYEDMIKETGQMKKGLSRFRNSH